MPLTGAAPRAAVPVSNARAEASRKNGAKSRGPRTAAGKARSAQNALKHGLRAQKHVLLPQEDAAEFAALEKALVAELAPVGPLQIVLAQRIAIAAWRLARADLLEAEVFDEMGYDGVNAGLALIRDGNGTRSIQTLMRYRGAAMAEFMRALRTLQALQAQRQPAAGRATLPAPPRGPNEPKTARRDHDLNAGNPPLTGAPPARGRSDDAPICPERGDPTFDPSSFFRPPGRPCRPSEPETARDDDDLTSGEAAIAGLRSACARAGERRAGNN